MRGIANSAYIVEGIKKAMEIYGNKVISGEEMREGLEKLSITNDVIKTYKLQGIISSVNISCGNHSGDSNYVYFNQWLGDKWVLLDTIKMDSSSIGSGLIKKAALEYAEKNGVKPRSCGFFEGFLRVFGT